MNVAVVVVVVAAAAAAAAVVVVYLHENNQFSKRYDYNENICFVFLLCVLFCMFVLPLWRNE